MGEDFDRYVERARLGLGPERKLYFSTNESMAAVVTGLDLQPQDRVLAIGGSGDQAFAMLEFAGHVTAIDYLSDQVSLISQRLSALYSRNIEEFLMMNEDTSIDGRRRNDYFNEEGRLDRIMHRLDNIDVPDPGNIVDYLLKSPKDTFNKVYLSNILGFFGLHSKGVILETLSKVRRCLSVDSLIYAAVGKDIMYEGQVHWESGLPAGLIVDDLLSEKAQRLELDNMWYPRVYRVVEPRQHE